MPTRILIVGGPYEARQIAKAVTAAGWEPVVADGDDSLRAVVASARPAVVILGGGVLAGEASKSVQILREATGRHTPVFFLGEAADALQISGMVEAVFTRPAVVDEIVTAIASRTGATRVREPPSEPAPIMPPAATSSALDELAARIDDAFDVEMQNALAGLIVRPSTHSYHEETPPPAPTVRNAPAVDRHEETSRPRQVDKSGLPAQGPLADTDLPVLLGRAYLNAMTGRLTFTNETIEKAIYFESGRPVQATSNATEDRMIEMLARQGKLTPEQHAEAVKVADESGRRMGALLLDLGVLKSDELLPAVREHYEEIIFSIFGWSKGEWRFDPDCAADPARLRLLRHPAALVREGLRRDYAPELLRVRLGSGKNLFCAEGRGASSDLLDEIVLDPVEQRLVFLFDGVRTLDEVVRSSGMDEARVLQIAFTLWIFGLLGTGASDRAAAMEPANLRDRGIERDRILTRYALTQESDYFQVFGLDRHSTADEIRRAYERLRRDFLSENLASDVATEMARELATIQEVLEEAYRVIGNPALRTRYRAQLARFPARLPLGEIGEQRS